MHRKCVLRKKWINRIFICTALLLLISAIIIPVYLAVTEDTYDSKEDMQRDVDAVQDDPEFETSADFGDVEKQPKSMSVEEKLKILEGQFPSGKYWNHRELQDMGDTCFCISDVPCEHSRNGYEFCNQYQGAMRDLFSDFSGIQCFGYASLISDLLFGVDAPISEHQDLERIRVGDHIRFLNAEHSVIVTEIGRDENNKLYVGVTECNADYENCRISWGRRITEDELTNIWVCTRYLD